MPSGMAGNCPSLRLSTPASLFEQTKKKKKEKKKIQRRKTCKASAIALQLVWRTVPATVSFAWVCTAAADTHRPTAHPAKLAGNRRLSSGENTWSVRVAFHRQPSGGCREPSAGCGGNYYPVCLKCWFCSRWMTATCTNSTFDSWRSNVAPDWKTGDSLT